MCGIFSTKNEEPEEAEIADVAADKRKRREKNWTGIIIHHTDVGGRKEISADLWQRLYENIGAYLMRRDNVYVSAHYIISRTGEIKMLVDPDTHEAYHAGKSSYWHPRRRSVVSDWNRHAIGIELVGDGNLHDYPRKQLEAVARLSASLYKKYPTIHPLAIVGHESISPGRKIDPGRLFDWRQFFRLFWSYVG